MARRPNPIVQRLALEGGDEIIAELKRLGLAGEVAGRELKKKFDDLNRTGLDPFTASLKRAQAQMQTLSRSFASIGQQFTNVGRTMSLAITAPIVAGFGVAVKAASDFESRMADIARVVAIPTPDGLTQLGDALRDMAVDLGVSIGDLQDIAQAAGQAGIPFAELAGFTEQVATSAIALNLSFGETGQALGKIQASLGLTTAEVGNLVDAIATLADDSNAADAEIIQVVQRIGSLGKQAGLSELEVAALGSSVISMGVDAESAGTAIRNMILNLSSGASATDPFREALAQLGLDAVDVAKRLQTDGIGTILDIFERLRQQAPEVRLALLQGLFDRRAAQSLAPLIANLDEAQRQLGIVGDQANFAGRTLQEFTRRAETPEQRFRVFKAALDEMAITIGSELMPVVVDLTERLTDLVKAFSESGPITKWGVAISGVAAAIGPFLFAIGQTFKAISLLIGSRGIAGLIGSLIKLRNWYNLTAAAGLLAFGPASAIVVGAGLVAARLAMVGGEQTIAARSAGEHRKALDDLKAAMEAVGTAGSQARDDLRIDAQAALHAAEATRELIKARVDEIALANAVRRADAAGFRGSANEDLLIGQFFEQERAALQAWLGDQDDVIAGLRDVRHELGKADKETIRLTRSTNEAADAIEEAGEKARNAFPGPAANVRSVSDSPFAQVKQDAQEAGDEAETSGKKVETATDGMASHIRRVPPEWRKAGDAAETELGRTRESIELLGPAFEELGRQAGGAFTGAGESVTMFGSVANDTLHGIEERATETATALPALFQTAAATMAEAFAAAFEQVRSELAALTSAVNAALSSMAASLAALRREISATLAAASAASSGASSGGGGGGSGFNAGGQVFGPGTATSDSIPAWLSAGEYVIRARAVDHYGPQLFAALNNLRLPRFNAGGIVQRIDRSLSAVRMHAGGPVTAMAGAGGGLHPVTINMPAGESVSGLLAPPDVIGTLQRAANRARLTQAGRGPARLK